MMYIEVKKREPRREGGGGDGERSTAHRPRERTSANGGVRRGRGGKRSTKGRMRRSVSGVSWLQSSAGCRMQPYPRSPDLVWPGHVHGMGCLLVRAMDTAFPTVVWRVCLALWLFLSWLLLARDSGLVRA